MSRLLRAITIGILLVATTTAAAKSPFSLVRFKRSKSAAQSSRLLTEDNGPWMIFVASFAGPGAEQEARQLVDTLRTRLRVQAYLHKKHYDFTGTVEGKGFDANVELGELKRKRMRHVADDSFDELAVLVGDFQSVDDPKLQKILKLLKYASAEDLGLKGKKQATTRRFAGIRHLQQKLTKDEEKRRKGPLRRAFVTRNPMIPAEAVAPRGMEEGIIEINKRVRYSLLKNPGRYTVRVASFRGQVVIDQRKIHEIETNQRKLDGRIEDTDDKAEALAALLRHQGVEAYVFHDHCESIVTVGSFAEVGRERQDGKIELNPGVARIIETYGPNKRPMQGQGGVALSGIQPKTTRDGKFVFDIAPQPIQVPRKSIATDYVRN